MTEDEDGPVAAARETARRGIAQARKTATDVITATKEKGEELIDDTREKTFRAAAETNRLFQEHPIAAVAAAAAAGAVIGIFLPRIALASRAGKLAGQAVRAVAASEVAQAALAGISEAPKAAARGVGKRLLSQRSEPGKQPDEQETPEDKV
jgi:ElaB/YqjD/DUF883 family membrane-anchored ribosome-binding protein